MGMTPLSAAWMWRLKKENAFDDCRSVIDFGGPQQLNCARSVWRSFATRFVDDEVARQQLLEALGTDGDEPDLDALKDVYCLFGLEEYAAIDLIDPQADYIHDFNREYAPPRQFDVVTNFGTVEHIFNVGEGFRTLHRLTAPGGVMLHILPTYGGYYHGFYNIHSVVFRSLAAANQYELLNMSYAHDISEENRIFIKNFKYVLDDITNKEVRLQHVKFFWYYFKSVLLNRERTMSLIHVALRKTIEAPFVFPQQMNKYVTDEY